ncbi:MULTISPECIES: CpsD/CapB family tyrosine-protein kinase [Methylomicrobium]|uniref:ATPase involved in chromosome partitioning n=1 Tax=Methylomicrobium album BG8 TaxID=686340 RepID=H8GLY8_METAL|nr:MULTISPECIES: CpsD/CapB family tyrosine-protein kinase [Methylomicrobium]EIC28184.1 ATPase involved in chromosome partitioning [Methylomicrobium album BG8]
MIKNAVDLSFETVRYPGITHENAEADVLLNNRVIMGTAHDPRADIFRVLRTNVLRQLRQNRWNSFVVTSATPGAGKTFVSINLAIAMAMEEGQNVLLVDAALKCPNVGRSLGLSFDVGLIDCLNGNLSLYEASMNSGIERLQVLPGRESDSNASELISSRRMQVLIREIKLRYSSGIVIFDLPSLFAADEALLFMPHVDAALLVVEDGRNTPDELQHAMYILEDTNLLGLVLNKSRQPLPTHQYG